MPTSLVTEEKEIVMMKAHAAEKCSVELIALKKDMEDKLTRGLEEAAKQHKEKLLERTKRLQDEMKLAQARQKDAEISVRATISHLHKSDP